LKKGLGTLAASYETFRPWANVIKNAPEETDYAPRSGAPTCTSATDERRMEKVKFVLERTCSISCKAIVTVGISPASVYRILTNSWGKRKVCAQWITHVLKHDQRAMRVLLATTHL
jgi:hypothetical protein